MSYQICSYCIMDNGSDNTINFDEKGECNYCKKARSQIGTSVYFPDEEGKVRLAKLIKEIKSDGKNKKYDAIMGISGGLDSSYLTYLGYKWKLRILLIHVDDGFDTEISKNNLNRLVRETGYDYIVVRPDEEQFCALTKAYMHAGVPNLAIPQDNILFAFIYDYMRKNKISYFLSGGNFALESILQRGNSFSNTDVINIKAINKRFGSCGVDKLKFISSLQKQVDSRLLHIKTARPLNYIEYNREKAFKELYEFCGFEYYGSKHLENKLTAFIQLYWFPKKFLVDKRRSHFSSMIVSGQMTRQEAIREMEKPLYDESMMKDYISFIKEKLHISDSEFEEMMNAQTHQHTEYRSEKDSIIYRLIQRSRK